MIGCICFMVACLMFTLLFCYFRTAKPTVYSLMLKTVASFCFLMVAAFAIKTVGSTSINLLIFVGLVLGLVGDILLDLKVMYPKDGDQFFVAGTSSFALGHFFYFLALTLLNSEVRPENLPWNILASIGVAMLLTFAILAPSKKMGLNFGKHFYIVTIYSLILTFMLAFSISIAIFSPIVWIFAGGLFLFLISDLVLSLQYFGGKTQKVWVYINHLLYYSAQALIAFSILYLVF